MDLRSSHRPSCSLSLGGQAGRPNRHVNSREYTIGLARAEAAVGSAASVFIGIRSTKLQETLMPDRNIRRSHYRLRRFGRHGRAHADEEGLNCLMLDAGPLVDFNRDRVLKAGLRTALSRLRQAGPTAARAPGERVQRQPVGGRDSRSRIRTIPTSRTTGCACG